MMKRNDNQRAHLVPTTQHVHFNPQYWECDLNTSGLAWFGLVRLDPDSVRNKFHALKKTLVSSRNYINYQILSIVLTLTHYTGYYISGFFRCLSTSYINIYSMTLNNLLKK